MSGYESYERQLFEAVANEFRTSQAAHPGRGRSKWRGKFSLNRPIALGATSLGALAALAAATIAPRYDGPLSAQEAVAAVEKDLGSNGVLHWRAAVGSGGVLDVWTDLATGSTRREYNESPAEPRDANVTWIDDRGQSWVQRPQDQSAAGAVVVRFQPSLPDAVPARPDTLIDAVHSALGAASRGEAAVENTVRDGVDAVRITQRSRGRATTLTLSRAVRPELLESRIVTWSCAPRDACETPTTDATSDVYSTLSWEVAPANAQSLRETQPPEPSNSGYRVIRDSATADVVARLAATPAPESP